MMLRQQHRLRASVGNFREVTFYALRNLEPIPRTQSLQDDTLRSFFAGKVDATRCSSLVSIQENDEGRGNLFCTAIMPRA
jgi:hypothetical protein